jgi:hypothetical protein
MRFSKLCLIVAVGTLAATQLAVAGPWERNAGSKTMGDYTGQGRVTRRSYSYAPAANATNAVAATPATPAPVATPAPPAAPAPVAKAAPAAPSAPAAAPAPAAKSQAAVAQQPGSTSVRRYSYAAPQPTYNYAPSYNNRRGISGPRYINAGRKAMGEY